MTQHDDELQEMMNMWQAVEQPIESMREDFIRKERKERLEAWGTVAVLVGAGVFFLVTLLRSSSPVTWVSVGLAMPIVPMAIWIISVNQRMAHHAPPLSPASYIRTMRHNLQLREKRRLLERGLVAYCMTLSGAIATYLWFTGKIPSETMGMLGGGVVAATCLAYYLNEIKVPADLAREHSRLDKLEEELSGKE